MSDETFFPGEPRPKSDDDIAARKVLEEKAMLERSVITSCMEIEPFRDWMMRLLTSFNTFGQTFASTPTGFPDPNATFFHLGMKAAGQAIFEQLDAICPDLAMTMRREARTPK